MAAANSNLNTHIIVSNSRNERPSSVTAQAIVGCHEIPKSRHVGIRRLVLFHYRTKHLGIPQDFGTQHGTDRCGYDFHFVVSKCPCFLYFECANIINVIPLHICKILLYFQVDHDFSSIIYMLKSDRRGIGSNDILHSPILTTINYYVCIIQIYN